jgi:hypothetical protein
MFAGQSGTQEGIVVFKSAAAINKDRLVQLADDTGEALVQHPSADGALCEFVALETVDGAGKDVPCQPLTPGRSVRVISSATIAGGAQVMAEASTGELKATSAGAGVYTVGVTEEDSTDQALCRMRPLVMHRPS